MGFFDYFPYTNFHELNLNWLLAKVKDLHAKYLLQEATLEQIQQEIKSLNVPEIVKEQINELIENGELNAIFENEIGKIIPKRQNRNSGNIYFFYNSTLPEPHINQTAVGFGTVTYIPVLWDDNYNIFLSTVNDMKIDYNASYVICWLDNGNKNIPRITDELVKAITSKFPNSKRYIGYEHSIKYSGSIYYSISPYLTLAKDRPDFSYLITGTKPYVANMLISDPIPNLVTAFEERDGRAIQVPSLVLTILNERVYIMPFTITREEGDRAEIKIQTKIGGLRPNTISNHMSAIIRHTNDSNLSIYFFNSSTTTSFAYIDTNTY